MARKRIKNELSVVFGPEPVFGEVTDDNYNHVLTAALHWYGQYGGANDSNGLRAFHKSWLREWAKENGIKRGTFTIPNQGISTVGSLARIALKGFPLKAEHLERLRKAFDNWEPVKPKKVDKEAHARLLKLKARNKHQEAIRPAITLFDTAIDSIVDGEKKWSVAYTGSLNATQVKELTAYYKKELAEIQLLKKGDKEVSEYYDLPKLVVNRLIKAYGQILEEIKEAGSRGAVKRKAKAVRRKKAKPASAHVRKLKYMTIHKDYNLASIDAEKLVGAQTAYVFDTKKRLLKVYEAMGVNGIEIGGTTLKNCKGVQKKIRKPEEQVPMFATMPKTKAAKEFAAIRAKDKECTGRMNADSIILKVF